MNYFDLESSSNTPQWPQISAGIHDDCARRYRDRKSALKKHFELVGGYEDVEEARNHPHESISSGNWNSLIDNLFLDPKYVARCNQNSSNRAKQPYANTSGSKSFAQRRYEEVQQGGNVSLIDGWRRMHTSHGTWVNERAQNDWNTIQEELTRMQQAGGEVDEEEVLKRALGERRGWSRGVGRKVRNTPTNVSALSESQFNELKEQIRQLNENVTQMQHDRNQSDNQNDDDDE
ncbi:hypothetical protein L1987_05300 [Smallanthus sonchifolius]|uniref:Uncharacterized protein n=1 Tax=Smallanthus sonchifolius TaxID=185202 RepID=A0ACB9JV81_9ASTR|nr:hypothetical protein L1987_05300 [Smallanthus sonchifolius]